MSRVIELIKEWMLPLAIVTGITVYLPLHFIPWLHTHIEPDITSFASNIQPVFVSAMLFLQFARISPHDLRLRKWHFFLAGFQLLMFLGLAVLAMIIPDGNGRILTECAMLCFICPTAAASGVITRKLGGSLADTVSYVVIINIVAAVVIPSIIPFVHPTEGVSFFQYFGGICMKVFPMLVLPLLLAWTVRYTMKRLQRQLIRWTDWAFYLWGIALTFSIYLATNALLTSGISVWIAVLIGLVSLGCTIIQFVLGRTFGRAACKSDEPAAVRSDSITAGQALGQKNSGFLIWLGYSYMTPVTSVAGGLYSIWQNLVNSWELYDASHHEKETAKESGK